MSQSKTLFAAVAVALGLAMTAPAAPALACGGYGEVTPEERAVREAIAAHFGENAAHYVMSVQVEHFVARAEVWIDRRIQGSDRTVREHHEMVLSLHRIGWVVSSDRRTPSQA